MKMFSTDSMAATGSNRSWQPREAALSRALVRPGCKGNSTISSPSFVTFPLLQPKHQRDKRIRVYEIYTRLPLVPLEKQQYTEFKKSTHP